MLVFAESSFAGACAIVQADSDVFVFIGETEARVFDSRRADGSACDDFCSVLKGADAFAGRELSFNAGTGHQDVSAEAAGLASGAVGHFGPADTVGESKIVFNL